MRTSILLSLGIVLLSSCVSYAQTSEDDNDNGKGSLPTGIHMNDADGGKMPAARKLQIWAASPLQFTDNGVGFSLSYEHGLDKGGIVTYTIPVVATFDMTNLDYTNTMVYIMPGLKFYPTSHKGKVKYAVGPSLVLGAGQVHDYYYASSPYSSQLGEVGNRFLLGVIVNNSINFQPAPHLYLGLEFGFGFSYINRFNDYNQGVGGIAQGCFKIGYKL